MTTYRFYLLGDDGKIRFAETVDCPTDAAALEVAEARLGSCEHPAIEVWDRARRIGVVGRLSHHLELPAQNGRVRLDPTPA